MEAIRSVELTHNVSVRFHQWLANEKASQYQAFIELTAETTLTTDQLTDSLETALFNQNMEYQQKRHSGRLQRLDTQLLKLGAGELYKQHKLNQGQREGQFKVLTLIYARDSDFPFKSQLID